MRKNDLVLVIKPACLCESRKVCVCSLTLQFITCNSLKSRPSCFRHWSMGLVGGTACTVQTGAVFRTKATVNSCSALWVSVAQATSVILCLLLTNFLVTVHSEAFTAATFSTNLTSSCCGIGHHSLGSWDLNDCFEIFSSLFKLCYKWRPHYLTQPLLNYMALSFSATRLKNYRIETFIWTKWLHYQQQQQ